MKNSFIPFFKCSINLLFPQLFSSPCINLPPKFTGDLILSYGGFLRIIGPSTTPEYLVRLTGNNVTIESSFSDDVRLDELNWRIFRTSDRMLPDCNRELNRRCMMVILQNVSNVAVKTSSQEDIRLVTMLGNKSKEWVLCGVCSIGIDFFIYKFLG